MKGDGSEGRWWAIRLPTLRAEDLRSLAHYLVLFCLVVTVVFGSGYFVFVGYVAIEYAESWLEKLRMLPLLIAALTIPLLGAVLIRKKQRTGAWR